MNQVIDTTIVDLDPLQLCQQGSCAHVDIPPQTGDLETLVPAFTQLANYLEDHSRATVIVFHGLAGEHEDEAPLPVLDLSRRWEKTLTRLGGLGAITMAAIDGPCERFGLQLALTCDYRVATERSVFCSPEIKQGYLPGMLTFRLAKFIGVGLARRMLFTGAPLDAPRAHRAGLVDELCADGELEEAIQAFAGSFESIEPVAIQLGRRLLDESFAATQEEARSHLLAAQHRCLGRMNSR